MIAWIVDLVDLFAVIASFAIMVFGAAFACDEIGHRRAVRKLSSRGL